MSEAPYASPIIPWEIPLCPWTNDGKWPDDVHILIEVVADASGIKAQFVPGERRVKERPDRKDETV